MPANAPHDALRAAVARGVEKYGAITEVRCMYGNTPAVDCYARACPVHGTPSASPYGKRQGARKES